MFEICIVSTIHVILAIKKKVMGIFFKNYEIKERCMHQYKKSFHGIAIGI